MAVRPEGCWCLGLGVIAGMENTGRFCVCPEGIEARQNYDAEQDLQNHQRLKARWEKNIPLRFQDWTLENSPVNDVSSMLMNQRDYRTSWFLYGGYGVGKTGLAVGYARKWFFEEGFSVIFCSVPDLLSELRSTYQPGDGPTEYSVISRYADVSVLVLDDLGAEQVKNQEWVADRLYQIIGKRHANGLLTIFTSNLSIEEVGHKIGERLTWRIVEMCGVDHILEVTGPNLRDRHE
jgi:DNA replication protein DnaC